MNLRTAENLHPHLPEPQAMTAPHEQPTRITLNPHRVLLFDPDGTGGGHLSLFGMPGGTETNLLNHDQCWRLARGLLGERPKDAATRSALALERIAQALETIEYRGRDGR